MLSSDLVIDTCTQTYTHKTVNKWENFKPLKKPIGESYGNTYRKSLISKQGVHKKDMVNMMLAFHLIIMRAAEEMSDRSVREKPKGKEKLKEQEQRKKKDVSA